MDLKIEESWLYDVWELYLDVMKKREARANIWHQDKETDFPTSIHEDEQMINAIDKAAKFLKRDKNLKKKKIYIRELFLGQMGVNLSYFKSPKSNWGNSEPCEENLVLVDHQESFSSTSIPSMTGQAGQQSGADAYRQWSENMTDVDVDERSQYANIISAVLPSISAAPIKFQERVIYHVYESEGDILTSLRSYYSADALKQIYKMLGSLDFVGNPTRVLASFRTGLQDFFLNPLVS